MRSVRVCVLGSGSSGNCLWVDAGSTRALFDCGLPLRETRRRCLGAGLPFNELTDVFLTHEHADHAYAAGMLGRKLGVRVHATRGTWRALRDPPPPPLRHAVRAGVPVKLGDLTVQPLAIPHDVAEPVAYRFDDGFASGAIVTDLGCAPAAVWRPLRGLDAIVLEMNHDLRMLLEGPYPWSLKKRIRGDHGHLSNDQGARLLGQIVHGGLRHVVLAHLSEHNNTEKHARAAAERALDRSRARVAVGSQAAALDPIEIGPHRPRQLALFA
jgi:phosphoribosyl 1,2-cyclic phosphodiesterase